MSSSKLHEKKPEPFTCEIVASRPRLTKTQMFAFKKLFATADAVTNSYFELKRSHNKRRMECELGPARKKHQVKLGFSDSSEEGEEGEQEDSNTDALICKALIQTIATLSSNEEPGRLESPEQAMKWASNCLLNYKKATVDKTRRETQTYVFDTEQTMSAFKLMSELNEVLSQARSKPS